MTKIEAKRIDTPYVSDDCVQVMFTFSRGLIVENITDNITLFSYDALANGYKNKYIEDQRKERFPYHKIPVYRTLKKLSLRNGVNQIIDYGKTYKVTFIANEIIGEECIVNGGYQSYSIYCRAVKDKDGTALLITSDKDIPELRLSPEQIMHLRTFKKAKVVPMGEPKIVRFLNRNINRKDLDESKKLVKSIKEKKTSY